MEEHGNTKITDDQLKHELNQGKSLKEIAEEYGYSVKGSGTSTQLSERVSELDIELRDQLSRTQGRGRQFTLSREEVRHAVQGTDGFDDDALRYRRDVMQGQKEIHFSIGEYDTGNKLSRVNRDSFLVTVTGDQIEEAGLDPDQELYGETTTIPGAKSVKLKVFEDRVKEVNSE